MKITSPAFSFNQLIPVKYTGDGDDVSPPLNFSGIPKKTKSLVLIVDDPDAAAGDWVHWLVYNLPPDIKGFNEGKIPKGVEEGLNGTGGIGWVGPCPPSGRHHYYFKLYALDQMLEFDQEADKTSLLEMMNSHILAQAELVGLYERGR